MLRKTTLWVLLVLVPAGLVSGCNMPYVAPPSHTGRNVGITLAVAGTGVAIACLAVHGKHFVKGCIAANQGGLWLVTGDGQSFRLNGLTMLTGADASVHAGEMVRLKGHKGSEDGSGYRSFLVEEVKKDYGPCKAATAAAP